jgi:hypothetical protein
MCFLELTSTGVMGESRKAKTYDPKADRQMLLTLGHHVLSIVKF